MPFQKGFDIILQGEIGAITDRVESNKLFQMRKNIRTRRSPVNLRQCSTRLIVWLSREKAGMATVMISPAARCIS